MVSYQIKIDNKEINRVLLKTSVIRSAQYVYKEIINGSK